ncbi:MAG: hypothetical protein FJW83_09790 [Actinobacteria bacterium]|nr:hypothetical protein [Actinomycetota bacterium]
MTRRALSRLLLTMALTVGSLAWAGVTLQRTVFDASRPARIAAELLEDDTLRRELAERIVDSLDSVLPAEVIEIVGRETLVEITDESLGDDTVRTPLTDTITGVIAYSLGSTDVAPTFDTGVVDTLLRARIAEFSPVVAAILPPLPARQVEVPAPEITPLRTARSLVERGTPIAAVLAGLAALLALAVAPTRSVVLRRVGWWALSTGVVWVVLRYTGPLLADVFLPGASGITEAFSRAAVGSMLTPGLVLTGVGGVLVAGSYLVGGGRRAGSTAGGSASEPSSWSVRNRAANIADIAGLDVVADVLHTTDDLVDLVDVRGGWSPSAPAQADAAPVPTAPAPAAPAPAAGDATVVDPGGPRWVPGIGYVYATPPGPNAEWVDGHGWVDRPN